MMRIADALDSGTRLAYGVEPSVPDGRTVVFGDGS